MTAQQTTNRNLAIDRFRGVLVMLMVAGDFISQINTIPSFLKHASDIGMTVADLVAPAFIFVIGFNFEPSFQRRANVANSEAYRYFLLRYLSLLGIGAAIAGAANMVGQPTDWGVLQSIGIAGLICLALIRTPIWLRFAIGFLILVIYQVLLDLYMLDTVLGSVHGGFFGAISWGGLLVLSTAVAEIYRRGSRSYLICSVALSLIAALSLLVVPVSKHRVSLSFVLITLAISALAFLIFEKLSEARNKPAGLLCWWGQNALALYLVHLLVLSVFVVPSLSWWYIDAPFWLVAIQLAAVLMFMSLIARWLFRRRHSRK